MVKLVGTAVDFGGAQGTNVGDPDTSGDGATKNYTDRTVLSTLTKPKLVIHQLIPHLLASGTFNSGRSGNYTLGVDLRCSVQGGAYTAFVLAVGINGGAASTPLYQAEVQSGYSAAAGVTDFHYTYMAEIGQEQTSDSHHTMRLTGLTANTVYTWQITAGQAGAGQLVATVGQNPYFIAISPDNNTLWVSNNGDNSVVPVTLGWRPGWSAGFGPVWTAPGTPIPVGAGPYNIQVSPNNQYVLVVNFTAKTATAINALTKQVIGTTAVIGTGTPTYCTFTQDSTTAWVSTTDGKVYPLTMSLTTAPTIGTGVLVRNASDNVGPLMVHPDGKTLWVCNPTATRTYAATLATNTTLGAFTANGGAIIPSGQSAISTPMTHAVVAASVSLSSTPFSLSVTGAVGRFPPDGGTILVPISGGYATVTYDSHNAYTGSGSGSSITFLGCVGGNQTSVAGNVILDQGVWVTGTGGTSTANHIPSAGGTVDHSYTTAMGCTGIWISPDNVEIWICGGTTVQGLQVSDGQVCLNAQTMANTTYSILGSTNCDVYSTQTPTGPGFVWGWGSGYTNFWLITQLYIIGKLTVTGSNA